MVPSDNLKDRVEQYLQSGTDDFARQNMANEAVDYIFDVIPELADGEPLTLLPMQESELNFRLILCAAQYLVDEGISVESIKTAELDARRKQTQAAGAQCREKGLDVGDVPYDNGTDEYKWWIEGYEGDESNVDV